MGAQEVFQRPFVLSPSLFLHISCFPCLPKPFLRKYLSSVIPCKERVIVHLATAFPSHFFLFYRGAVSFILLECSRRDIASSLRFCCPALCTRCFYGIPLGFGPRGEKRVIFAASRPFHYLLSPKWYHLQLLQLLRVLQYIPVFMKRS